MKKTICIGIIIIIMIVVIYMFASPSDNKENNTVNNEISVKQEKSKQNEQINEIFTNEVVNEVVENEVENTVSSETFEENPKTSEEKAIDIAKKDWGNDSSVNFLVEGMDGNGNYIVAVRNSETVALAFYSVNIADESFTKREMN